MAAKQNFMPRRAWRMLRLPLSYGLKRFPGVGILPIASAGERPSSSVITAGLTWQARHRRGVSPLVWSHRSAVRMYQCELCGEISAPGEQAHVVIVETREVSYPSRSHSQPPSRRKDRTKRKRWGSDPGGEGAEIVNESIACGACADHGFDDIHHAEAASA